MISNAVGSERLSRTLGYKVTKGNYQNTTSNLPQRIAILAEANEANQSGLSTAAKEITTAQQAGTLYGFGSPIHAIMRIIRPVNGEGVGGIPTVVYPQAKASGAVARVMTITPSGTATKNGTHNLVIAGRYGLEGGTYAINIEKDDTVADITPKIAAAINSVLGCPVSATSTATEATATAKWAGLTSNDITITVDEGDDDLGLAYVIAEDTAGSGTPDISASLALFGNEWNTIVINSYGTVTTVMDALEAFNGTPDPDNPDGRYSALTYKPFVAFTGSVADDPSSITDTRLNDVTIAICPTPLSAGLPYEAAANFARLAARQMQDSPHLDIQDKFLPDMPTPISIGSMADYNNRDAFVKKGCSTVDLVAGAYKVMDFVTTYHPIGEEPAQFRYVRNLNIDWNYYFGKRMITETFIVGKAIANDDDDVRVSDVIKPKEAKQLFIKFAEDMVKKALIVDSDFTAESMQVGISTTNPDRLDTFEKYKRSGFGRIVSSTVEAGFNFGTL